MIPVTLLALTTLTQRTPDLVSNSTLIADTKGWGGRQYQVADFYWLDHTTIVLYRNQSDKTNFYTRDIKSNEERRLKFSIEFNRTGGGLDTLVISPDGRKALWGGIVDKEFRWFVSNLDGTDTLSFPRRKTSRVISNHGPDDETTASWSTDSKTVFESIIEFGNGVRTLLWSRSLSSIKKESTYPSAVGYVDWQPEMIGEKTAFARSGLAIGGERSSVGFITWNIESPKQTRKEWTVTVPRGRSISSFSVSPNRKSILWDLSIKLTQDQKSWESSGEEMWLTDIKGRGWRRIAQVTFDPKKRDIQSQRLGSPKWRPDGKAFSFIYDQKLYVFPLKKVQK